MSPMYPLISVYVARCPRGQCRLLRLSPQNCKYFNTYNYIATGSHLTYTYTGQVQQPYNLQLVKDRRMYVDGPGNQCHACDENNAKYCVQGKNRTHISCIMGSVLTSTPPMLPDFITVLIMPERSVQTITKILNFQFISYLILCVCLFVFSIRAYQYGHRLVTVCAHGDFIVLSLLGYPTAITMT